MVSKWTQPMIERKTSLRFFVVCCVFCLTGTADCCSQPATWILGRLILLLDVSWNLYIITPCKTGWWFQIFLCSLHIWGNDPI